MKKIIKELKSNLFFNSLLERATGYRVEKTIIKIFNLQDEVTETILKNRLPNVKRVSIKPNLIKIYIGKEKIGEFNETK